MSDGGREFQKIHDSFRPKILRYLTRLVGRHEAEDLTQEVLVKASQGLNAFRGESRLSTWIYRIATNAALDKLRSRQKVHESLPGASLAGGAMEPGNKKSALTQEATPSIEQQLIRKEMNECIRGYAECLPANYRTVVVLSELEGLTNNEIAEVLGITLDTVKVRLHRARARLREELEQHCRFYRDERNELACDLKSAPKDIAKA